MAEPRTEAGKRLAAYVSPASDVHEGWYPWRVVRDAILAIEAEASGSVGAPALDVERLGRAIVEHRTKFWATEPCDAKCAPDIAAEYARLATPAPEEAATPERPAEPDGDGPVGYHRDGAAASEDPIS